MRVDRAQAVFAWGLSNGYSEKVAETGVIAKAFSLVQLMTGLGLLQQLGLEQFRLSEHLFPSPWSLPMVLG